ncbi:hypothetical protein B0H19DRAFT_1082275 [Mycena capillaripes]|nr:hypothetical protein B0H19DRAFT_1082275 [Mycena capillaripes]
MYGCYRQARTVLAQTGSHGRRRKVHRVSSDDGCQGESLSGSSSLQLPAIPLDRQAILVHDLKKKYEFRNIIALSKLSRRPKIRLQKGDISILVASKEHMEAADNRGTQFQEAVSVSKIWGRRTYPSATGARPKGTNLEVKYSASRIKMPRASYLKRLRACGGLHR